MKLNTSTACMHEANEVYTVVADYCMGATRNNGTCELCN